MKVAWKSVGSRHAIQDWPFHNLPSPSEIICISDLVKLARTVEQLNIDIIQLPRQGKKDRTKNLLEYQI